MDKDNIVRKKVWDSDVLETGFAHRVNIFTGGSKIKKELVLVTSSPRENL
ncbi:Hypothetical protein FKW44_009362 [Caligus rogercresseyi]|uniref:Uncharacterized protein n=1 Tax=Caligus rogercresseyi TaxID=217165 RepID=A0A7T8K891_CALRO|nr:Hypothetical protein FKW44_009362 [Caligus rogercresseyi]